MYQISKQERDSIVNYLANSLVPAKDAIGIINLLNGLKPVEERAE